MTRTTAPSLCPVSTSPLSMYSSESLLPESLQHPQRVNGGRRNKQAKTQTSHANCAVSRIYVLLPAPPFTCAQRKRVCGRSRNYTPFGLKYVQCETSGQHARVGPRIQLRGPTARARGGHPRNRPVTSRAGPVEDGGNERWG